VFVDRRDQPAVALIWSDACYLAGCASDAAFNADLLRFLHTEVMPRTEHLLIYPFADDWRDALDDLLRQDGARRVNRTVFDWDPALFAARHSGWRTRIPEGYAVQRIDARTAAQVGGIVELWGNIDAFLAKGFGFCVLKGDTRVSSCQTVFVGDKMSETGVGTEEPYRRQGLATLAACAYLEHCLDNEIQPTWGCYYNVASGGLAQKLGFTNRREVEVAYVHVAEDRRPPRQRA
jgi:RimJ/RimL family protein N-acetyltransferase